MPEIERRHKMRTLRDKASAAPKRLFASFPPTPPGDTLPDLVFRAERSATDEIKSAISLVA
jgi:hypothetical protein